MLFYNMKIIMKKGKLKIGSFLRKHRERNDYEITPCVSGPAKLHASGQNWRLKISFIWEIGDIFE